MPNRLAHETSPYLRQHAENPVDWYPWGREALDRARDEDKPILLSVGYSTCHWCHVMAHESFEDAETARVMNEHFVCIKVDREELPDLDQIYQAALQVQGESGGWPLTMFLFPDGTPFYGGTYFPPRDQFGRPSFRRVLDALATTWQRDRAQLVRNAGHFRDGLGQFARWGLGAGDAMLGADTVDRAAAKLEMRIDKRLGGFEGAPKFPNPKALELLLRASRRARRSGETQAADETLRAVVVTLEHMARGGIYDQLGGGFARYSTDERWLVPHFEKMLYDNAQLLVLYAECHQLAPRPIFTRVIRETAAWLERDLRDQPSGGLMTAMDADSEGLEGKYYVWTPTELRAELVDALGEEEGQRAAALYARCYGVVEGGNWRDPHGHGPVGASILHLVDEPYDADEDALLARAAEVLLRARYRRVPPITDDKLLASSNGLAIAGLAEAGRILGDAALVDAARRTADFVLARLDDGRGGLCRTYKGGQAKFPGTLEDHAYVADGLIALYEASGEARYLEAAHRLTRLCIERFWDEQQGAFYMTASGDPRNGADGAEGNEVPGLILRPLSRHDGAVPSGMSVCVENLVRLGDVCDEPSWLAIAERALRTFHDQALANPFAFANLLCALDLFQERPAEIVLAGPDTHREALRHAVAAVYLPNRVLVQTEGAPAILSALVAGKGPVDGRAAAWVCRDHACQRPTTAPDQLREQLD